MTDLPEPRQTEASQSQPVTKTSASRSIWSFWNKESPVGPSTPSSTVSNTSTQPQQKRKRKKPEDDGSQAKIVLATNGAGVWGVKRVDKGSEMTERQCALDHPNQETHEDGPIAGPSTASNLEVLNGNSEDKHVKTNGRGKGKSKPRRQDGEKEEMREMSKKVKQAGKVVRDTKQTSRGRKRKSNGHAVEEEKDAEDDFDESALDPALLGIFEPTSPRSTHTSSSPKKRKGKSAKEMKRDISRQTTRSISPSKSDIPPTLRHRESSPSDIIYTGHLPAPINLKRTISTNTNTSKGASQDDPIDVEARPGLPKKHVFASDSKATHSFFKRIVGSSSVAEEIATTNGSTPNLVPTEVAPPTVNGENKVLVNTIKPSKVHSFFQTNGLKQNSGMKSGWGGGVKEGEEWYPAWPGGLWPLSDSPSEIKVPARTPNPLRRRRSVMQDTSENCSDYWKTFTAAAINDASPEKPRRQHPPPKSDRKQGQDRESWCERFRPKAAAHCLGNETEATYLRDWLSALSVGPGDTNGGTAGSGSGRKIIRKIKRRKVEAIDDWIVDDIGLFGDAIPDGDDEEEAQEEFEDQDIALGERPTSYPSLLGRLTNTILLTGTYGSGKSAAVYAAAHELGWDVFEVYPGIGKRTWGNLMGLVGDVGKNHMVVKTKEENSNNKKGPRKSFFKSKQLNNERSSTPVPGSQGSIDEPIKIDDRLSTPPREIVSNVDNSSPVTTPRRNGETVNGKIRQSLILIDEVDILFEEENTFWPAIISLIADSRRPVILTCNDSARVLVEQLPLQTILHFHHPQKDIAVPYLETIAKELGFPDIEEYVDGLYQRLITSQPELFDQPLPPNGHEWLPYFDLRKAISQMQLERGSPPDQSVRDTPQSTETDLNLEVKRLDSISFADAWIDERPWALMELYEIDRYSSTPDDELGIRALLKPQLDEDIPILPGFDKSAEMADELRLIVGAALPTENPGLQEKRTHYIRSLLPLLDPLIPLNSNLLPHSSLFTDYIPSIRSIILAEDIFDAEWQSAKAGGEGMINPRTGRLVRLSGIMGREGYVRRIDVGEEGLRIGRKELVYDAT